MRKYAAELVALAPEVILASTSAAVSALLQATRTIPIVFAGVADAVGAGYVESLARPGGNVTGLQWEDSGDIGGKKVQLFKQLVPTASRMAVVGNPTVRAPYWPSIRTAALAVRMEAYAVDYSSGEELDRVLATVLKDRPSAIWFGGDAIASPRKPALCDFALKNHFPTLTSDQTWPQ
jgi:putative tryptophan/tyrosine transport system substrate-binding protein